MTDETTTAEQESTSVQPTTKTTPTGIVLELNSFKKGSNNEGFKFWVPSWTTLDNAENHFSKISKNGKSGKETILALLNAAVAFRIRNLATSKLLVEGQPISDAKRNEMLAEDGGDILITEDDAMEYIPGERETSSISGYQKQLTDLKKAVVKAKADNNIELARKYAKKWTEVRQLMEKLLAEQQAKDADIMAEFNG